MGRTDTYGRLTIKEENGILTAQFRRVMKYGKLKNGILDIIEVEQGVEIGGSLTEQQIKEQGYKPVCEIERPEGADFSVYREYEVCFVQVWKQEGEDIVEGEIWTSDSGTMPSYADLERLKRDVTMVKDNINSLDLSNKEALSVKDLYPVWSADGEQVQQGDKYQYNDKLYEVVQSHTTQENWAPANQSSLWVEVTEHAGTMEDPIPYNEGMNPLWQGMILYNGKYYTQAGVKYKCIRDTGNKVVQSLADLVSSGFVVVVNN